MSKRQARMHAIVLGALLALFVFRVVAQLVQAIAPTSILPAFDDWHSGTLPYPVLVLSQVAIIALLVWLVCRFWLARPVLSFRFRPMLWVFAGIYFVGSMVRFIGGFTFATENAFMSAHLPGFFHVALAAAAPVIANYVSLTSGAQRA